MCVFLGVEERGDGEDLGARVEIIGRAVDGFPGALKEEVEPS